MSSSSSSTRGRTTKITDLCADAGLKFTTVEFNIEAAKQTAVKAIGDHCVDGSFSSCVTAAPQQRNSEDSR